jgi:hypothetical protein
LPFCPEAATRVATSDLPVCQRSKPPVLDPRRAATATFGRPSINVSKTRSRRNVRRDAWRCRCPRSPLPDVNGRARDRR